MSFERLTRHETANLPKDCGVCHEDFDSVLRHPRLLPCHHRLCSECITALITNEGCNNLKCPFCRKSCTFGNNASKTASDFIVDYSFLELLSYIKDNERKSSEETNEVACEIMIRELMKESSSKHLTMCKTFKDVIQKTVVKINSLEEYVLRMKQMREQLKTYLEDTEDTINKRLSELQSEQLNLRRKSELIEANEQKLDDLEQELFSKTNFTDAGPLLDKKLLLMKASENILREVRNTLSNDTKTRKEMKSETVKMIEYFTRTVLVDTLEVQHLDEEKEEQRDIAALTLDLLSMGIQHNAEDITIEVFRKMNGLVKNLIQQGRIMAFQDSPDEMGGLRRYSRISLSEDNVFLHFLKDEGETIPKNVYFIKYDEVTQNSSTNLVFLDLSYNGESLGRIHIELFKDGNYPQNFRCLCSGVKGPSYALSNILGVDEEEKVRFGDYEKNDGSGGKAVVPGVNWGKEVGEKMYQKLPKPGSVVGFPSWDEGTSSQFFIATRDDPNEEENYGIFGYVMEGLDVLTNAISEYSDEELKKVVISDCGVILHPKPPKNLQTRTGLVDAEPEGERVCPFSGREWTSGSVPTGTSSSPSSSFLALSRPHIPSPAPFLSEPFPIYRRYYISPAASLRR